MVSLNGPYTANSLFGLRTFGYENTLQTTYIPGVGEVRNGQSFTLQGVQAIWVSKTYGTQLGLLQVVNIDWGSNVVSAPSAFTSAFSSAFGV